MNITLIGSGNVATVLGKRLAGAGHRIVQVLSPRNAATLAALLGAEPIADEKDLNMEADLYLLTAGDTAVYTLAETLRLGDALVAHTAGSIPLNALQDVSKKHGVFYPLQSLRKEAEPVRIPLLIDGSDEVVRTTLFDLAVGISDQVQYCGDLDRQFFHIGAVIVNNFPNYLYTLTAKYLQDKGLEFDFLLPLLSETVGRLEAFSPAEMQTGPAVRGDIGTLDRHRELLRGYPELGVWYDLFSEKIAYFYNRK
jgi:predicted short-subunit dehydrogenase-like oxidoreductase (DUF2520 family)